MRLLPHAIDVDVDGAAQTGGLPLGGTSARLLARGAERTDRAPLSRDRPKATGSPPDCWEPGCPGDHRSWIPHGGTTIVISRPGAQAIQARRYTAYQLVQYSHEACLYE